MLEKCNFPKNEKNKLQLPKPLWELPSGNPFLKYFYCLTLIINNKFYTCSIKTENCKIVTHTHLLSVGLQFLKNGRDFLAQKFGRINFEFWYIHTRMSFTEHSHLF